VLTVVGLTQWAGRQPPLLDELHKSHINPQHCRWCQQSMTTQPTARSAGVWPSMLPTQGFDLLGAALCLVGMVVIMYAARAK
jgi:hypothetical protein